MNVLETDVLEVLIFSFKVHDMEFAESLDVIVEQTLPALEKAQQAGKIRFIGITGYPLENFRSV